MIIAFPPCTNLAVSGAAWFTQKRRDGRQQSSINFFMEFTKLKCPTAIENPIGIMSTVWRKPDQIIQKDTKCKTEKCSLYIKTPTIKESVGAIYCKNPIQYKGKRFVPALNNNKGKEVITPVKTRNTLIFGLADGNARVEFCDKIIR